MVLVAWWLCVAYQMESLLRSFVGKVQHLEKEEVDATEDTLHHFLCILSRPTLPDDILDSTLEIIDVMARKNDTLFLNCKGVETLVNLLARRRSIQDEDNVISLMLDLDGGRQLKEYIRSLPTHDFSIVMQFILQHCTTCVCLHFVTDCLRCSDLRPHILALEPLRPILASFSSENEVTLLATFYCVTNCIDSHERCLFFWTNGGSQVVNAMASMRVHHGLLKGQLLRSMTRIVPTVVGMDELQGVYMTTLFMALSMDVSEDPDPFIHISGVRHLVQLYPQELVSTFVSAVFDRFIDDYDGLTHFLRLQTLDVLIVFCNVVVDMDELVTALVKHLANAIPNPETDIMVRIGRLMCQAFSLSDLAVHFAVLWNVLCQPCLDSAEYGYFDHELAARFDELVHQPQIAVFPLVLHGPVKSDILFHVADTLFGGTPPPPDTTCGDKVHDFLVQCAKDLSRTVGNLRYVTEVRAKYDLEGNEEEHPVSLLDSFTGCCVPPEAVIVRSCVSKCPVTLMPMHLPVIASDGHTYELQSMVQIVRQGMGFVSPMTRATLRPWVVINQQVLKTEMELSNSISALCDSSRPRRRRNRSSA